MSNPFEDPKKLYSPTEKIREILKDKKAGDSFKVYVPEYDTRIVRAIISNICRANGIEYKTLTNENGELYMKIM